MTFTSYRGLAATAALKFILSCTVAAGALAFPAAASAQTAVHGQHEMSKPAPAAGKTSMDMQSSMEEMHKRMKSMSMTGHHDMDFAMMMVSHHQGAIDMARAELARGKDAQMIGAAKKIIAAQKKEIAMFEAWMKKHPHPAK